VQICSLFMSRLSGVDLVTDVTLSAYQSAIVGVQMQAAWQEVFSNLQTFKV